MISLLFWASRTKLGAKETCLIIIGQISKRHLVIFVRASGEAILATERYCSQHLFIRVFLSRLRRGDFRYATILYQNRLSKLVIKALYQS